MLSVEKLARALDVIDSTARKLDEASIDLSGNIASTADSEAKRLEREIGKLLEAALAELERCFPALRRSSRGRLSRG